ncbi:MCE family protein [Nocardioides sp. Kera G14]|uniref:MCE family protein n=1 Tax=Nocardioides sp. Kera G14 TaxID=2884264 RepID=UPI001D11A1F7|nr:MlaD family protein [Nocardioides sp. Kera G14]UDY22319.1 MCE family protein [Nocardioides sp. Kera G14]
MGKLFSNRLYLSLVGVIAVFVVSVAYLLSNVLDVPLTGGAPKVAVEMSGTGGLYKGSEATYRGVKVGKVTDIQLTAIGVKAIVTLTGDYDIPASTRAQVRSLSPVGEQYVDFQPTTTKGPYLKDGSVVPGSETDLPKSLGSTVVAVNNVLSQIDDEKLHSLLDSLATGLNGTGDQIGHIVDQGDEVLAALQKAWPQTKGLIDNAGPAIQVPVSESGDLEQLATSAKQFAAFLKDYDPELTKQLEHAPAQLTQVQSLVDQWGAVLPGFLPAAATFLDLFGSHSAQLRAIVAGYARGVSTLTGFLTSGALKLEIIGQKETVCRYGTTTHGVRDARTQLQTGGHCPASAPNLQRGAAHAPGATK